MPKPRRSQAMITWKAKKRQERQRQLLRHIRFIAVELATLALLVATTVGMVLVMVSFLP